MDLLSIHVNVITARKRMKQIEIAIMNEIVFLRMQGLSDKQVKLLLEQQIIRGLRNATKLSPNENNG